MKILTLIFLLTLSSSFMSSHIYGQNTDKIRLSQDSILYYFKNYPPFEAWNILVGHEYYMKRGGKSYIFDYQNMYNNKEIKFYIIKLLDRKLNCEYELKKQLLHYITLLEDKKRLKDDIESFLYYKKLSRKIVDSLSKIPSIIIQYRDSVILERKIRYRKNFNCATKFPDIGLIRFFKYREVYDSIKNWDKERGNNIYFKTLLEYNDPDALRKLNELMFRFLEDKTTQGENSDFLELLSSNIRSPSIYRIISQILHKQTKISSGFENEILYFQAELADFLILAPDKYSAVPFTFYQIYKNKFESELNKPDFDLAKLLPFIRDNLPTLKKAALELADKLEKEEEYWMKDMPFYKKK